MLPAVEGIVGVIFQAYHFSYTVMHVILNGEQLEEVDCGKYLESQVATDGGCDRDAVHRMNEGAERGKR